jgi:hypothetical protein
VGRIAAARDAEKWSGVIPNPVATEAGATEKEHENTRASYDLSEGYDDSRGGTRTRDPGIMSAVL